MDIKEISVEELIPYEFNNKLHDATQVNRIANSIKEFGFLQPIVIDKNNIVVVGHGRLEGAKKLGLKTVPCLRAENLTEEQIKKYRILDNKLNESEWDVENLKLELEELPDLDFGDLHLEISDLFPDLDTDETETEIIEDEAPEVQAEAKVVEYGDIFQLGNHRLMCGDSTKLEDVETLMDGENADMVFTDPPYGVDYEGINNDSRKGLSDLLDKSFSLMLSKSKKGASVYCFHSDKCADIFNTYFRKYCHFSSMIIWKKKNLVLSQTDYQSIHEPCLYGRFDNGNHQFYGDRKQTSVRECERDNVEGHTTPKPIKIVSKAICNSTRGEELVLDLFGGSGSTLIACEQLNRKCYMMELDPKYVEVIIKRFHKINPESEIKCLNREININEILSEDK